MPRTVEPLTDTKIRNAKPREKAYKLFDGGGLYLEVMTDGRKLWRFKYTRPSGAENRLGFGTYPTVGLAQARGQRDNARAAVAAGEDPGALKIEARRAAKIAVGNSFEAVARDWHSTQKEAWTPTYASKILVSLENDVFPLIGAKPINQIKAPEILDLLRIIEARGVRDTTKRVLQRMRAVFQYGIVCGACERNPAADIDSAAALKTVPVKHMARVSAAELPQLLRDIDQDQHGEAVTKLALQFMTLTFPRTKEMILAKWDEFDVQKAEWRIPADRMKMRNAHIVPLSRQALAVLEKLREFNGHRENVFYSAQAKGPISNNTMLFALYRLGYRGRMTGHGFRGLASTTLNEMGFRADVVERQLAHIERNKVRAAYNHAQYLPERREMMQAWGDYIDAARSATAIE